MKSIRMKLLCTTMGAAALACSAGTALAGSEGTSSTHYGFQAGLNSPDTALGQNTLFGTYAGVFITTGQDNTLMGMSAGSSITTGGGNVAIGNFALNAAITGTVNTALGGYAGSQATGSGGVFLGYNAGRSEAMSNRLYIDNCYLTVGGGCDTPLVYGEFDNRVLRFDGVMHVTANRIAGAVKSQLHFSVTGDDTGGWLTSAGENNFFTSSGARYDAVAGGWIQRSVDGKAVIAGSGAAGFRVLTSSDTSVDGVAVPISRLHIDYNGAMGVNSAPAAGRAINTSTGAYLSSGGVWTNASSRALKRDIHELSAEQAIEAFQDLKPVTFEYLEGGRHVGFIAEDVPALVGTADRKGLAAMDVVAVVTKVVQQQASEIAELKALVRELAADIRRVR